jgi:RNA polymerase sigma-54 factor
MLLQLKKMNVKQPDVRMAICLLEDHFQDLRGCQPGQAKKTAGAGGRRDPDRAGTAGASEVRGLFNPETSAMQANPSILPDFIVIWTKGEPWKWPSTVSELQPAYQPVLDGDGTANASQNDSVDKSTKQYLRSKLSARRNGSSMPSSSGSRIC